MSDNGNKTTQAISTINIPPKRIAILAVPQGRLFQLITIDQKDIKVHNVFLDPYSQAFCFVLESERFPENVEGEILPRLIAELQIDEITQKLTIVGLELMGEKK